MASSTAPDSAVIPAACKKYAGLYYSYFNTDLAKNLGYFRANSYAADCTLAPAAHDVWGVKGNNYPKAKAAVDQINQTVKISEKNAKQVEADALEKAKLLAAGEMPDSPSNLRGGSGAVPTSAPAGGGNILTYGLLAVGGWLLYRLGRS